MLNSMCKSAMARAQLSPHFLPCTRMLSTKKLPWNSSHPHISVRSRQFSQSTAFSYPRKDSQDRNSIDREATEYTRSGSDDQTAAMDDAAFNPDLTDPDSQKKKTGAEDVSSPLTIETCFICSQALKGAIEARNFMMASL